MAQHPLPVTLTNRQLIDAFKALQALIDLKDEEGRDALIYRPTAVTARMIRGRIETDVRAVEETVNETIRQFSSSQKEHPNGSIEYLIQPENRKAYNLAMKELMEQTATYVLPGLIEEARLPEAITSPIIDGLWPLLVFPEPESDPETETPPQSTPETEQPPATRPLRAVKKKADK